ncbi:MAG: DUF3465 domain-containing protein [Patescibacteria group bacterium]|nr:DUF3465 domain-containing protein [Patescibacteria group bacterium]
MLSAVENAFQKHFDHIALEAKGEVVQILADDTEDVPHQRFIFRCPSGQTVLVAHNLDRAKRIPVSLGDAISLKGMYVWNEKGGLIHETHADAVEGNFNGWIKLNEVKYA